jgi:acyl-CoA reductase-like NAD-dependent aldehyde dehydrogenase
MKREMGGNGAAIVLSDADPQLVARLIGRHTNQHYGQTCCTVHRVYVERKIADDFIDAQRAFFSGLKIGYQADAGTQLGAVINSTQRRRILQAQQETAARGGQPLLSGGEATVAGKNGFYLKPALYRTEPGVNCNPWEVFHSFATICPVASPEEALQLANSSPYGLGASVWTKDIKKAHYVARRLKAGTVWINTYNVYDTAAPFGGYKQSGFGREMSMHALEHYTQVKSVWVDLNQ